MLNIYRWLAAAAGVLVVGFMVWYFHTIVFYILLAAVFSLMGKPIVGLVQRINIRGWRPAKWMAALCSLVAMGAVLVFLVSMLFPVIYDKVQFISNYSVDDLNAMLSEPIAHFERWVHGYAPNADFSVKQVIENQLAPVLQNGYIQSAIGSVTTFVVDLFVAVFSITFITFFFLKEERLFNEGVVLLFPKRYEDNIRRAISSVTTLLIRYFIGICIESFIKLICVALPLYFMGFEFSTAMLIGLVTAVLNVIPYVGPLIGGVIAFVIAALTPVPGVPLVMMVFQIAVVLSIFQLLDNVVLQPYIYSSSVKAHPLEIFIVILMAGYIAGIMGMLFAIPAYTVLRVFAKEFFNNFRVVQKLTEKI